jgi:hypothetical protein
MSKTIEKDWDDVLGKEFSRQIAEFFRWIKEL